MNRHATTSPAAPRGATGTPGTAAAPPPKCSVVAAPAWLRDWTASFPATVSAAAASTVPNPILLS